MSILIYAEGYSEENLVKAYFHKCGITYSNDALTITSNDETNYLKNCESDSAIMPAIGEDLYLLQKVKNKQLVIIQDIDKSICYSKFKANIINSLISDGINLPVTIINSRPKIEVHYLEEIAMLKRTILSYINQRKGLTHTSFDRIDPCNFLNPTDYYSISKILHANNVSFSKKDFSERYFNTLFKFNKDISLTTRLKSIL